MESASICCFEVSVGPPAASVLDGVLIQQDNTSASTPPSAQICHHFLKPPEFFPKVRNPRSIAREHPHRTDHRSVATHESEQKRRDAGSPIVVYRIRDIYP